MKPVSAEAVDKVSKELLDHITGQSDPLEACMPLLERWAEEDPEVAGYVKTMVSGAFDRHGFNKKGGKIAMSIAVTAYAVYRMVKAHAEDPNSN